MPQPPSSTTSLVEWFVEGVLDDGSGLTQHVRENLREATRGTVDAGRENQLDVAHERRAAALIVDDVVRSSLADVLDACNADESLSARARAAEPVEDADSAAFAAERLMKLRAEAETEVEKAACHHAAHAAEALRAAEEGGGRDDLCTAVHNAGRVLGELIVAGREERALQQLRGTVRRAMESK